MTTATITCTNCGKPETITYDESDPVDRAELLDALAYAICDDCVRAEYAAARRPSPAPNPASIWSDERGDPSPY